jgi:hypothetical protein
LSGDSVIFRKPIRASRIWHGEGATRESK